MATHKEPEKAQWPCSVCSFTFDDSYALETHKTQTGHRDYICSQCGKVFQTEGKFKQHSQFPSPCYTDVCRARNMRNAFPSHMIEAAATSPAQVFGRADYVDPDIPTSTEAQAGK